MLAAFARLEKRRERLRERRAKETPDQRAARLNQQAASQREGMAKAIRTKAIKR